MTKVALTDESGRWFDNNQFTETESRDIYRAAYIGLTDGGFREGDFDVVMWPDGEVRPYSSGCASQDGAMVVFSNVSASDFGEDCDDENEFVEGCMNSFGCVHL